MTTQAYNLPPIRVGDNVKIAGERSRIDGRKALVGTITGIIGGTNDRESRSASERFIVHDGINEWVGLSRSQIRRIK